MIVSLLDTREWLHQNASVLAVNYNKNDFRVGLRGDTISKLKEFLDVKTDLEM